MWLQGSCTSDWSGYLCCPHLRSWTRYRTSAPLVESAWTEQFISIIKMSSYALGTSDGHLTSSLPEPVNLCHVLPMKPHRIKKWAVTVSLSSQALSSIKADRGQANDGLSSALLVVFLDSARNLPVSQSGRTSQCAPAVKVSSFILESTNMTNIEIYSRWFTGDPVEESSLP